MITSEELLTLGKCSNCSFLYEVLASRCYRSIINKCSYCDPNYGTCWFQMKLFPLGSAEEVIVHAIKKVAFEVSLSSDIYYNALRTCAYSQCRKRRLNNNRQHTSKVGVRNLSFSCALQPYNLSHNSLDLPIGKKLKILFGTSQIEA